QPGPPGDHHGPHGPPPRPRFPTLPLLAAILVSLVSSALLAWYFAKPIRHLRAGIAAAAAGRLDQQVSAGMGRRRDELADLGRDFDRMSGQLRQLLDSRRRLLHDVSHELRSPLARLQAAIGLARQQPDKLESYLQRIERESERMDQLVGELLTLARLEADASTVGSECFNLGELLGEISEDARFEAEAHGRQLTLHGDFDCPLQGNSELLYRAIENVIRNAIRHTPPDSAVEVAGQRTERTFSLSIRDHGPGLTAADLEKIFAPFYRAATSEPSTGHGLGLTLARRVIEAHGGQITARNHPAGGLEMHIELPQQR
ncbi:MAG: hypothetical protein RIR00_420, partial [Pseudomonadota bacterium]